MYGRRYIIARRRLPSVVADLAEFVSRTDRFFFSDDGELCFDRCLTHLIAALIRLGHCDWLLFFLFLDQLGLCYLWLIYGGSRLWKVMLPLQIA